jgi:ferric-chelate reductase
VQLSCVCTFTLVFAVFNGGFSSFESTLDEGWLRVGIAAMVAFSMLIIVSLRPIRSEFYEVFFYTHFFAVL